MIYHDKKSGKYVRIDKGMVPGTFTFFKTTDLKKKGKSVRVRRDTTLPGAVDRAWYDDPEKAEAGLAEYAARNGWEQI